MADAFIFELVSPERLLLSEEVTEVVVPGTDGYFTVMAHHAPTMSTLQPGVATVKTTGGAQEEYVIFGGFIDVMPNSCTVLAESAVSKGDLDKADLDSRIAEAKEAADQAEPGDAKTKADTYYAQLTTLQSSVLN